VLAEASSRLLGAGRMLRNSGAWGGRGSPVSRSGRGGSSSSRRNGLSITACPRPGCLTPQAHSDAGPAA
jgi:hypothetical protein